jgi:hypothetical protein
MMTTSIFARRASRGPENKSGVITTKPSSAVKGDTSRTQMLVDAQMRLALAKPGDRRDAGMTSSAGEGKGDAFGRRLAGEPRTYQPRMADVKSAFLHNLQLRQRETEDEPDEQPDH